MQTALFASLPFFAVMKGTLICGQDKRRSAVSSKNQEGDERECKIRDYMILYLNMITVESEQW